MRLLTLEQLAEVTREYINQETKISHAGFTPSKEEITGLVNKIFKTITLDGEYDEGLDFMDGYKVPVGNTLEEWYEDFVSPEDYDIEGKTTNKPRRPSYRPAFYSDTLGRKTLSITKDFGNLERAFNTVDEYNVAVDKILSRLYNSLTIYENQCKRELIGAVAAKHESVANDPAYDPSKVYKGGERFQNGVILKDYDAAKTLDVACKTGYATKLDLVTTIAKPTDSATGEAFIESVKLYASKFTRPRQGFSYNGNIAGKGPKYILLIKEGIKPNLEVQTMAGAFQADKLAFPVETIEVKDFGSKSDEKAFAMLVDARSLKLHNAYRAVREQLNGEGDFLNYFLHDDEIAYWSPNVMTHVWVEQA